MEAGTAAAPAEGAKLKTRNPHYHVLRRTADGGALEHLTNKAPVAAANRKEAIQKATALMADNLKVGEFIVVPAKEWWAKHRRTRTVTQDAFE